MAVSFSPPPGNGTLPADGGTVSIGVTSSGGSYAVFLRLADGSRVRLDIGTVWGGTTIVRITLPPGGLPPGATLSVVVNESSGGLAVANYS